MFLISGRDVICFYFLRAHHNEGIFIVVILNLKGVEAIRPIHVGDLKGVEQLCDYFPRRGLIFEFFFTKVLNHPALKCRGCFTTESRLFRLKPVKISH